ncbi:MAG: Coenzyme F420 hydrogenase/dehydrogenase, beta subunit C-terminal domain [Bacteroidales bacterium]|nr:Coenzyme F420 hydrogenase/dehydrogenase, beta subunit C-terminal domain [Bacteroidales bacterium]
MPVTDRVTKQQCCGCSACSAVCPQQCIEMKEDELGFLHPFIDSTSCIGCSLCEKTCPCLQSEKASVEPELLFAAKIKDNSKLTQSTSGGVFTFLAEKVLKEQGVVCAARFDTPTHLIHDFCTRIDDLDAYKGSKYLQSDMRNCYLETKRLLSEGRKVLFVGTSCQIMGLKLFLRKPYSNLIAMEIVCHGVPSPFVWSKYLSELCNRKHVDISQINKIEFRNKDKSWREYNLKIEANGKVIHRKSLRKDPFLKAFLRDLMLKASCEDCPAKNFKSNSDIIAGDFWGVDNFHQSIDDDRGVSCLILQNADLLPLFEDAAIELIPTKLEYILRGNPSVKLSSKSNQDREKYLQAILKNDFIQTTKPFVKNTFRQNYNYNLNRCKKLVKKLIGILKK